MTGLWMFLGTVAIGAVWLAVASTVFRAIGYLADHAAGWMVGMSPKEIDKMRNPEQ